MNMKIIIIAVLAIAILLGVAFYFIAPGLMRGGNDKNKPVALKVWGLWEQESDLKPAIDAYKKDHPNVTIEYVHQSSNNYRTRAHTQISAGQGPDIFMIHNSWVPMFTKTNDLAVMPNSVMGFEEFKQNFNQVVIDSLTKDKKIYAIPRGIDGLVMYYNPDILQAAGVTIIPQTWEDFTSAAIKTTVIDAQGHVNTAGAALGTTGNVDHWSDILGLLFYENPGASLENPANGEGAEVLSFYTNFVTKQTQKTWDTNLEPSTQAFAAGKLAFYFAPSWRAFELRQLNPTLKFETAPVPQLPGRTVGWATFWAMAVSAKSANQAEAWQFLKYLTSAPVQKQLYQQAASVRLFGLPYSQISIQKELEGDKQVGSVIKQAPNYKYWYLSSNTFDQGINDEIIKYYEDAVNAVVFQAANPLNALETAQKGIKQTLGNYTGAPTAQ